MRKLLRRLDAYTLEALNPVRPSRRGPSGLNGPSGPSGPEQGGPDRSARHLERDQRRLDRSARRAERNRRRRIAAELAGYRTPAERTELDLILARHSPEQVREIEDLLPSRVH